MLLLAFLSTSGSINGQELLTGQIYNTQNLTNNNTSPSNTTSTWQNVGLWNQGLPCWGPGGPIYCGPDPYFNNGSFNFSYGTSNVYQVTNIANALPKTGTGLLVNGYNFGFTAKNGNGWDDGRVDYLTAYVNFNDAKNTTVYSKVYDLNSKFDWTTFNYSETFITPFASKDLSTATYGFVGRDNNFWAGPYGPEIYNINFSLKYSVDPCVKDPLYSPTCPGFLDALNKQTSTTSYAPSAYTGDIPVTNEIVAPTTTAILNPPTAVNVTILSIASSLNKNSNTTNTNDKSSITSFALSVISKNAANDKSVQDKAVNDALFAASTSASNSLEQATLTSMAQSQTNNEIGGSDRLVGMAPTISGPLPGTSAPTTAAPAIATPTTTTATGLTVSINSTPFAPATFILPAAPLIESPKFSDTENNRNIDMASPTDFVAGYLNTKHTLNDMQNTVNASTVNSKAQDNDAAGSVSIASIAKMPPGYDLYTSLTLKDTTFYKPEELYKGQKTVDNVRILRGLTGASDRVHQEIVDSQYNKK